MFSARSPAPAAGTASQLHLGERWDGQTIEQAREEWRRLFRATAFRATSSRSPLGANLNRDVVLKSTIEELRLCGRGLYRVTREIDYRRCYTSTGGSWVFAGVDELVETHSSEYICDGSLE